MDKKELSSFNPINGLSGANVAKLIAAMLEEETKEWTKPEQECSEAIMKALESVVDDYTHSCNTSELSMMEITNWLNDLNELIDKEWLTSKTRSQLVSAYENAKAISLITKLRNSGLL